MFHNVYSFRFKIYTLYSHARMFIVGEKNVCFATNPTILYPLQTHERLRFQRQV